MSVMGFCSAKPVWIKGKEREMNSYALFATRVTADNGTALHIAGTAFYRVFVNGGFIAAGPARTAKGYLREDILPLPAGECEVVIEACGYYCQSYSSVKQPSLIAAEIIGGSGDVIAYTGRDFAGYTPGFRIRKVDRFSLQRFFCEVWDYRGRAAATGGEQPAETDTVNYPFTLIDRRAPYPLYEDIKLTKAKVTGNFVFDETLEYRNHRYSSNETAVERGCFPDDEVPYRPYPWIQRQRQTATGKDRELPVELGEGEYALLDFGEVEAGFITGNIEAFEESDVVIGFSEDWGDDTFRYIRMSCENVIEYILPRGGNGFQSFEPYTASRVIVMVKRGRISLKSVGVKTYMYDISGVSLPPCENEKQRLTAEAAVRTFAHNAVDLYTDCPCRERAGWLCDSYFTARAEYAITGKTLVEDAFLENYRLFKNEGDFPDGVIPMCYPSDRIKNDNAYMIPQWTMWYILEVEEYILKRGHGDMRELFRDGIYGLLSFYRRYENADGLLENLPSWNFVEWSKANKWTQDVNYPTNFLYSRVLEAVYNLYGDTECEKRCREVRETAVKQSFNGKYFLDHAVREDGKHVLLNDSSEACQYYAVLFSGIDINAPDYAYLKNLILGVFSPDRHEECPEIIEADAFIGVYLRLDTLLKMGEYRLALRDTEGFFGEMSESTRTLWEYRAADRGSKDHGFASYAYAVIAEAADKLKRNGK